MNTTNAVMAPNQTRPLPVPTKEMKFSTNWNGKLYCRYFTTIRLDSQYWQVGEYYRVMTKDGFAFRAVIHEKKLLLLSQLPAITAALDTGYRLKETQEMIMKMYPGTDWSKTKLAVMLVENIEWRP